MNTPELGESKRLLRNKPISSSSFLNIQVHDSLIEL